MSTAPATPEQTAAQDQPLMTHRQIMLVIVGLMAGMFLIPRSNHRLYSYQDDR